jgi:hypothetical protein
MALELSQMSFTRNARIEKGELRGHGRKGVEGDRRGGKGGESCGENQ